MVLEVEVEVEERVTKSKEVQGQVEEELDYLV
jgi:hypothetical protein